MRPELEAIKAQADVLLTLCEEFRQRVREEVQVLDDLSDEGFFQLEPAFQDLGRTIEWLREQWVEKAADWLELCEDDIREGAISWHNT